MTYNGSAASNEVSWSGTAWIWAWFDIRCCQTFDFESDKWRTWNGPAATVEVSWPQTAWVFAKSLLDALNLLSASSQKSDLAWQIWATESLFHNKTSFIGHIWRTWNGPAATVEVSWLQTAWVLVQIWLDALNLLSASSQKSDLAWQRWCATRSLFHSKISLIDLIWRTWDGPTATVEVSWLQTAWVWAQVGWMLWNYRQDPTKKVTWLGRDDVPPGACFTAKQNSLVSYGGHGMVQQLLLRCHGCKQQEFWPRVSWMPWNFWQDWVKRVTWLSRDDVPPGACFTAKYHSLVSYGGHGMVQQLLLRCHGCKQHEFWPRVSWMVLWNLGSKFRENSGRNSGSGPYFPEFLVPDLPESFF
jgi:hypothetical protein